MRIAVSPQSSAQAAKSKDEDIWKVVAATLTVTMAIFSDDVQCFYRARARSLQAGAASARSRRALSG